MAVVAEPGDRVGAQKKGGEYRHWRDAPAHLREEQCQLDETVGLVVTGSVDSVQPYLAQSITPNSDHTKWTIAVRPNVVFHNGTPLTAAAAYRRVYSVL